MAVGICLFAGYIGSLYTTPSIPTWYAGLQKPGLNPPTWVFEPVWTALYILMGISLCLIWQSGITKKEVCLGFILFAIQLGFNIGWLYLFFGLHWIFYAFICIIALWAVLFCTILQVSRFYVIAGALLIPYLLCVSFAVYLNYAIMMLNP